ncbi:MAG: T9SS type A sorting domain-containing protein [Janthinobacterium lividum]
MRSHLFSFLLLLAVLCHHTALAQVVAPSQGGEVGLVLVTATTMELTFGNDGNGQGRVVAIGETSGGMPIPLAATDNVFYSANTIYGQGSPLGQGYVIYNGPDHSVTVTGLKPNTYYYVTDAEYDTDGNTIAYNTYGMSMAVSTTKETPAPAAVAPLPVVLTSFTGNVNTHNLATLRWVTATEQHTAYFVAERSADGIAFTEVGKTAAAGNSSKLLTYEWLDEQPLTATTYYRLRQVDLDGSSHYSQVIALSPTVNTIATQAVDVYPNPSAGKTIQILLQGYSGELFQAHLTDALGRTVMTQVINPAESYYLTPLSLPQGIASGNYVLTLAGSGNPIQKRIIVSN